MQNFSETLPTGRSRINHLTMRGIVKRFPGVLACDRVDFDIRAGEVHALLGENGAGKSTLMKILYGLYQPDGGEIAIDGKPVRIHSPTDAINLGIGMIHQHFMLVDTLTVRENVALGLASSRGPVLDLDRVEARIRELSKTYGLQIDPRAPVWTLAVGERQRVEIIKALYRGAALLILDEPTAVLTPQEVDDLFVTLKQMARDGHSLIFISHKLHEVINISHRITVLRGGQLAGATANDGVTRAQLARMMVGREVLLERERAAVAKGETRLELRNVSALGITGQPALRDVSLQIQAGEILGVAGVSGNGQRELAEVIAGLRPVTQGTVYLGQSEMAHWPTGKRTAAGLAYIPEERMHDGVIQEFTVAENLILQDHTRPPFSNHTFLNFKAIGERSPAAIGALAGGLDSREEEADERPDDRDHDKELDEREARGPGGRVGGMALHELASCFGLARGHNPDKGDHRGAAPRAPIPLNEDREALTSSQRKEALRPGSKKAIHPSQLAPSPPLPPASRAFPPPVWCPSNRPGGPQVERSGRREVRCRSPPGRGIDERSPASPGESVPPGQPTPPRNGPRAPFPRRPASLPPPGPVPPPPGRGRARPRRGGGGESDGERQGGGYRSGSRRHRDR